MPTIYAAMRNAILACTGAGDDWQATTALEDRDLECVAASPAVPERVFCGTFESGLHRSTDGGDTWERVGARVVEQDAVMSAVVSPHDPDEVWVGTEPSAIYRTTDGGDSWDPVSGITDLPSEPEWSFPPRPHTHHVRWIELAPDDPDRVYVGIEAGAFVLSRDGGDTWEERPPGSRRDNHQLATHPDAPDRVYSAAGDGYAESTDRGESWDHPQAGLDHRYVWSVAVDPGDPDTVLVSSASGAGKAHGHGGAANAESYVYRREGGADWDRVGDGLPAGDGVLRAVLAPGERPGECYAVNNHGLYRSTDAGVTWHRLDVPWREGFETRTARGLAVLP